MPVSFPRRAENENLKSSPTMCVLRLGTGNALAYLTGWTWHTVKVMALGDRRLFDHLQVTMRHNFPCREKDMIIIIIIYMCI
jgi:hypothetical protein